MDTRRTLGVCLWLDVVHTRIRTGIGKVVSYWLKLTLVEQAQ